MEAVLASNNCAWTLTNLLRDNGGADAAWDRFVEQHPKGSIFHTSSMIRMFRAASGHSMLPLAAIDRNGEILAMLVAVRVQTLPDPLGRVSSRSILYAEPLCHDSPESIDALAALIAKHDDYMRHRVVFTEVRPFLAPGPERIALERCGYVFQDYLNYVLDLTPSEEVLWSKMRKSARRGVHHGQRRGFRVRGVDGSEGIGQLYHFLRLSYGKSRVPVADRSLFEAAFADLHPRGMLKLLAVYDGDAPIAMDSLLVYKGRALAWYGGLKRMAGVSPFDYLQWEELVAMKQQGNTLYDFGGAGWPNVPYGVRDFKAKFGGDLVNFGRYRKVYAPWKLALAERVYEFGRKVLSPK